MFNNIILLFVIYSRFSISLCNLTVLRPLQRLENSPIRPTLIDGTRCHGEGDMI